MTAMTDLRDAVFNDLRQAAAEGRMPSTREPLPLRSIADAVSPLLAKRIAEARAEGARQERARVIVTGPTAETYTSGPYYEERARADAANDQELT